MTYRALLTDREREVLRGDADVSQNYLDQIRYRVRKKIGRLEIDVRLLHEHQPDLAETLSETVSDALEQQ